jgi:hypothetical protein
MEFLRTRGRWALLASIVLVTGLLSVVLVLVDPKSPKANDVSRVHDLANRLGGSLVVALITGLLAMAAVQLLKNLSSIRGAFHRNEIAHYVGENGGLNSQAWYEFEKALGTSSVGLSSGRDRERSSTRDLRYFFDLPLEQLSGQISAAAELALSKPADYKYLLSGLVGQEAQHEVDLVAQESSMGLMNEDPSLLEARNHVGLLIQRSIDSMQIIVGHRWRWFMRSLAVSIAIPLAILETQYAGMHGMDRIVVVILATLLGGVFAWTTRDAAAAIERIRR